LNSGQFLTLFGLILLALAVTYITHWVRYVFMGILGLGIIFVLLTGILPLYENIPSISDFISSQKAKIINQ
jgi:intracellular septation protein A